MLGVSVHCVHSTGSISEGESLELSLLTLILINLF